MCAAEFTNVHVAQPRSASGRRASAPYSGAGSPGSGAGSGPRYGGFGYSAQQAHTRAPKQRHHHASANAGPKRKYRERTLPLSPLVDYKNKPRGRADVTFVALPSFWTGIWTLASGYWIIAWIQYTSTVQA